MKKYFEEIIVILCIISIVIGWFGRIDCFGQESNNESEISESDMNSPEISDNTIKLQIYRSSRDVPNREEEVKLLADGETYSLKDYYSFYGDRLKIIFPEEVCTYDFQLTGLCNDGSIYVRTSDQPRNKHETELEYRMGYAYARGGAVNYLTIVGYDEDTNDVASSSFVLLAQYWSTREGWNNWKE